MNKATITITEDDKGDIDVSIDGDPKFPTEEGAKLNNAQLAARVMVEALVKEVYGNQEEDFVVQEEN